MKRKVIDDLKFEHVNRCSVVPPSDPMDFASYQKHPCLSHFVTLLPLLFTCRITRMPLFLWCEDAAALDF